MGTNFSMLSGSFHNLFHNKPFPVNTGALEVVLTERFTPAYGKSKIPHVQKYPKYTRDAMGRIVIEDGLGRRSTNRPPYYVVLIEIVELFLSMTLSNTDYLNTFMKNTNMLALCMISSQEAIMLCDGNSKNFPKNANELKNYASLATKLKAGPNRLNESQLIEVIERMRYAYNKFGVGALVMHQNKFSYRVIVPNKIMYDNHKTMYDARENAYDIRHFHSKRTRSGKNFDNGTKRMRLD